MRSLRDFNFKSLTQHTCRFAPANLPRSAQSRFITRVVSLQFENTARRHFADSKAAARKYTAFHCRHSRKFAGKFSYWFRYRLPLTVIICIIARSVLFRSTHAIRLFKREQRAVTIFGDFSPRSKDQIIRQDGEINILPIASKLYAICIRFRKFVLVVDSRSHLRAECR